MYILLEPSNQTPVKNVFMGRRENVCACSGNPLSDPDWASYPANDLMAEMFAGIASCEGKHHTKV